MAIGRKGHLTYHSTTVMLIFASMLLDFSRSQMPTGMETDHFQANSGIFGLNSHIPTISATRRCMNS